MAEKIGWGPIQGMDTIPKEIARDFLPLFEKYLPGWSVDGKYNFQAGASCRRVVLNACARRLLVPKRRNAMPTGARHHARSWPIAQSGDLGR